MPIVTVQVTREGTTPGRTSVTAEEKARIIAGVSQVMLDVLNKPLESTSLSRRLISTTGVGVASRRPNTESA